MAAFCKTKKIFQRNNRLADCFLSVNLIFATQLLYMDNEIIAQRKKDISYNWVHSSTFIFYMSVFCMIAFLFGGSCMLYNKAYKGKPDVEVPDNTLYVPKYK